MADDDIIRGGLDIVTDKKINRRQSKKPSGLRLHGFINKIQFAERNIHNARKCEFEYEVKYGVCPRLRDVVCI